MFPLTESYAGQLAFRPPARSTSILPAQRVPRLEIAAGVKSAVVRLRLKSTVIGSSLSKPSAR
jgi:hypothetical protein